MHLLKKRAKARRPTDPIPLPPRKVGFAVAILILLVISKYFYLVSLTNYYTFYLIQRFNLSVQGAQYRLFAFTAAVALGTILLWGREHFGPDWFDAARRAVNLGES